MGLPRQEHWSGLPFPFPGDISDAEIKPMSPVLAGGFFSAEPPGKPIVCVCTHHIFISSSVNGYLGCFHIFAIVDLQ